MRSPLLVPLFLFFLNACAHRDRLPPSYEQAFSLRGLERGEIEKRLGAPADQKGVNVAYWYLRTEGDFHPEPTPKLHAFYFDQHGKLTRLSEVLHKQN